jgi:hypothetical protein
MFSKILKKNQQMIFCILLIVLLVIIAKCCVKQNREEFKKKKKKCNEMCVGGKDGESCKNNGWKCKYECRVNPTIYDKNQWKKVNDKWHTKQIQMVEAAAKKRQIACDNAILINWLKSKDGKKFCKKNYLKSGSYISPRIKYLINTFDLCK